MTKAMYEFILFILFRSSTCAAWALFKLIWITLISLVSEFPVPSPPGPSASWRLSAPAAEWTRIGPGLENHKVSVLSNYRYFTV